jgi:hypothetical protein
MYSVFIDSGYGFMTSQSLTYMYMQRITITLTSQLSLTPLVMQRTLLCKMEEKEGKKMSAYGKFIQTPVDMEETWKSDLRVRNFTNLIKSINFLPSQKSAPKVRCRPYI